MKQNMRNLAKFGRKGMALLLALVMVLGVCMPVYATGDATEPTVQETTVPETSEPTVEPTASELEPTVDTTAQTQLEPSVPEDSVPQITVPDMAPAPEKSAYELAMEKLAAMAEEAKSLEATEDALDAFCEEVYNSVNYIADLWDADQITDAQYFDAENQAAAILTFLETTYGYADGKIQVLAELPDAIVGMSNTEKLAHRINGVVENATIHLFDYTTDVDERADAVLRFKGQVTNNPPYYNRDVQYVDKAAAEAGGNPNAYDKSGIDGGNAVNVPKMSPVIGSDGYPYANSYNTGNGTTSGSLKYLFNKDLPDGETQNGVTHFTVQNDGSGTGFFQKRANGNYYYDSAYNHAEYDGTNFQLYDFALRPYGGSADFRGQGHLLPFNTDLTGATKITKSAIASPLADTFYYPTSYDSTYTAEQQLAIRNYWRSVNLWSTYEDPTDGTTDAGKFSLNAAPWQVANGQNATNIGVVADDVWVLGNTFTNNSETRTDELKKLPDYWYGMSVEFTFNMPTGRKVDNREMIFEFSGDDDVWVYVDDALVLDLGGGACDYGYINFTTGEVVERSTAANVSFGSLTGATTSTVNGMTQVKYSLSEVMKAALNEPGYNFDSEFSEYSQHTFKFFYMERGTGTANCRLEFNMEPLPAGSVNVTKELTEDSVVTALTENDEYTFLLEKKENGVFVPVKGAEYTIGTGATKYYTGSTEQNKGIFTLKKGQTASFTSLEPESQEGTVFRVTELTSENKNSTTLQGISYNKSAVTGTGVSVTYGEKMMSGKATEFTIRPTDKTQNITHDVVFTNELAVTDFSVYKKVTGNMGDRSKDFSFTATMYTKDPAAGGTKIDFDEAGWTDGVINFTLHHDETKTFTNIPLGAYVVVEEDREVYVATASVDGGAESVFAEEGEVARVRFTTDLTENNHQALFTNRYNITIDTGIALDSLPYIVIIGIVVVGAVFLFLRKRKAEED